MGGSDAPIEVSSKVRVPRKKGLTADNLAGLPVRKRALDPRFTDKVAGNLDLKGFREGYRFLEEYRTKELKELEEELSKQKDPDLKAQVARAYTSLKSREDARMAKIQAEQVLHNHKKQQLDKVKQGGKPYYLKKNEQRKLILEDKYSKLSVKKLDRVIEKKNKKIATKERKRLPIARKTQPLRKNVSDEA